MRVLLHSGVCIAGIPSVHITVQGVDTCGDGTGCAGEGVQKINNERDEIDQE